MSGPYYGLWYHKSGCFYRGAPKELILNSQNKKTKAEKKNTRHSCTHGTHFERGGSRNYQKEAKYEDGKGRGGCRTCYHPCTYYLQVSQYRNQVQQKDGHGRNIDEFGIQKVRYYVECVEVL